MDVETDCGRCKENDCDCSSRMVVVVEIDCGGGGGGGGTEMVAVVESGLCSNE